MIVSASQRQEGARYLRRGEYVVRDVPLCVCQRIVARYHYAHGGSNTATFRHGLFHRSDTLSCLGIAWWIPPTRPAAEATWDGDWQQVLTLSRLVLVPGLPTNAASFLIGESIRRIRRDGRWRCLVTYADTWQGHTGQIYRATNWEYLGLTTPEPVWVNGDGHLVARKAGPATRRRDEMERLGYRVVGCYAKHKFRLILPPVKDPCPRGQPSLWR